MYQWCNESLGRRTNFKHLYFSSDIRYVSSLEIGAGAHVKFRKQACYWQAHDICLTQTRLSHRCNWRTRDRGASKRPVRFRTEDSPRDVHGSSVKIFHAVHSCFLDRIARDPHVARVCSRVVSNTPPRREKSSAQRRRVAGHVPRIYARRSWRVDHIFPRFFT